MYPDFIGIGAQKAGTTWLHRNLALHPEIHMPRKEVHYFDRKIHDSGGVVSRFFGKEPSKEQWRKQFKYWAIRHTIKKPSFEGLIGDFNYYLRPYTDEWYGSIFKSTEGRTTGEITPAYSVLDRDMVAHVHELVPNAKIIFMMRNPIERAWSQAVMSFDKADKGSAKLVSEKKFLRKVERASVALLTDYWQVLETWRRFYPEEQIFVGFLEDVRYFPEELLRRVYEFLGVDSSFEPARAQEKIHSRSDDKILTSVATRLARTHRGELEQLNERFGGYASFWLYCAKRLIEASPAEEHIAYPLWESPLWEGWTNDAGIGTHPGSKEAEPQSGVLSSIQSMSRGG